MTQGDVNKGRRRFLGATTAVVGAVGVVGVAVPFVKSWNPSEKAKAIGGPVKVDLSKIEEGALITEEWRGKPIYILKRSAAVIAGLNESGHKDRLLDPESNNVNQQPEYAHNETRSVESDVLIVEGVCTHLGCAPKMYYEVKPEPFDEKWSGGFFCPCHGSRFDLAGRVFKGVPAPSNLKVPKHQYDGSMLVIGEDGGVA